MLKAVIFDMDGVLIDSEPVHMEAFKRLMESLSIEFDKDYYLQFIGSTTDYMWEKVIKDYNLKLTDKDLMKLSDIFVSEINGEAGYPIMKGAAELINKISSAGIKLAVASSSGIERIEDTVRKLGVYEKFDALVSGKTVQNPKPAPDTFLKAAELLKVSPAECIVIEDSLNGMKAAKHAGMVCVMYENLSMGQVDSSYADYVVQGFEELDAKYFEMIYCHKKGEP